jgi:hypothetical protein
MKLPLKARSLVSGKRMYHFLKHTYRKLYIVPVVLSKLHDFFPYLSVQWRQSLLYVR